MRPVSIALVLLLSSGAAQAQVVDVQVSAPTITFEAPPPLVEVSPGVQVVPDREQEVYFVDGWYWTRHGKHWFRTRDHRGGWVVVGESEVPQTVVVIPPGKYKKYKAPKKVVVVAPDGEVVKYKVKKVKYKKAK